MTKPIVRSCFAFTNLSTKHPEHAQPRSRAPEARASSPAAYQTVVEPALDSLLKMSGRKLMILGIALVIAGLALVVIGRERADGTSFLSRRSIMFALYPTICLAFLALGLALIISSL
jgi:hypothetical protein